MWLFSWLRNRNSCSPVGRSCTHGSPRKRATFHPRLEALEDRWLPSTLTVLNNLDSGSGSLRGEIALAHSGDTIVFDPSLAGQQILLTSGQLLLNTNLSIQGLSNEPVISGGGSLGSRVFEVAPNTTVTLNKLAIVNGTGRADALVSSGTNDPGPWDGDGGGILNLGTLTVSGCTLSGNTTIPKPALGGGIYNAGALTVTGSTLSDNSAGEGGGIYNDASIYHGGGTLTVSGSSTLSGNTAGLGGGIYNSYKATASVTGSTLSANSADAGGGIYNLGLIAVAGGSTLSGNTATSEGGGIYNAKTGKVTIQSSVVDNNISTFGGVADIYNLGTLKISNDSTVGVIGP